MKDITIHGVAPHEAMIVETGADGVLRFSPMRSDTIQGRLLIAMSLHMDRGNSLTSFDWTAELEKAIQEQVEEWKLMKTLH